MFSQYYYSNNSVIYGLLGPFSDYLGTQVCIIPWHNHQHHRMLRHPCNNWYQGRQQTQLIMQATQTHRPAKLSKPRVEAVCSPMQVLPLPTPVPLRNMSLTSAIAQLRPHPQTPQLHRLHLRWMLSSTSNVVDLATKPSKVSASNEKSARIFSSKDCKWMCANSHYKARQSCFQNFCHGSFCCCMPKTYMDVLENISGCTTHKI